VALGLVTDVSEFEAPVPWVPNDSTDPQSEPPIVDPVPGEGAGSSEQLPVGSGSTQPTDPVPNLWPLVGQPLTLKDAVDA